MTTVCEHPPQSLTFISDEPTNRYRISIVDILTPLKNIGIDMVIFENIAIDIDIDKEILKISISIRQL